MPEPSSLLLLGTGLLALPGVAKIRWLGYLTRRLAQAGETVGEPVSGTFFGAAEER